MYEETRALFGKEVRRRLLLGNFVLSAGFYEAYVEQAQKVRTLIARGFDKAFGDVDVILAADDADDGAGAGGFVAGSGPAELPRRPLHPARLVGGVAGAVGAGGDVVEAAGGHAARRSSLDEAGRSSTSLAPSSFRSGVHE